MQLDTMIPKLVCVCVWINSDQQKRCWLTKEKMDRSTPMKTEQACNGLQLADANGDGDGGDGDDKFKYNRTFLPIKTNQKNDFLLQSVENVTLTGRICLLKCASFRTENGTKWHKNRWDKGQHKLAHFVRIYSWTSLHIRRPCARCETALIRQILTRPHFTVHYHWLPPYWNFIICKLCGKCHLFTSLTCILMPTYIYIYIYVYITISVQLNYLDVCWTVHHCDNWRIKTNYMPLIILLYFL